MKMDAVKFTRAAMRMCNDYYSKCWSCPAGDNTSCKLDSSYSAISAEEKAAIVEQWAAEHPIKTLQSVFLKMLPNVPLNDKGQPAFCPKLLDTEYHPVGSCCLDVDICQRCMDNFWGQEVEE